jgi:CRP/FNR family transcriptional regulator, cyclic AMP receptor protein
MDENELLDLVKDLEFFKEFETKEIKTLGQFKNNIIHYTKGERVIAEGEIGQEFYILLKGEIAITKNSAPDQELNTLNPGALFGEVPLVSGSPRLTNAVAKNKILVLKMDQFIFSELPSEVLNRFFKNLLNVLIGRLNEMNNSMADVKKEFQQFITAYDHVREGIDQIFSKSKDLKMVQNLSYEYFNKLRK